MKTVSTTPFNDCLWPSCEFNYEYHINYLWNTAFPFHMFKKARSSLSEICAKWKRIHCGSFSYVISYLRFICRTCVCQLSPQDVLCLSNKSADHMYSVFFWCACKSIGSYFMHIVLLNKSWFLCFLWKFIYILRSLSSIFLMSYLKIHTKIYGWNPSIWRPAGKLIWKISEITPTMLTP